MTESIHLPATPAYQPPPAPAPGPGTPTPAPRAAGTSGVLQLLDGVEASPSEPRGRCVSAAPTRSRRHVDRAMEAVVEGDTAGVDALVREDRRVLGALGRLSPGALGDRVGRALYRGRTGLLDRLGGNHFAQTRAVGRIEAGVDASFRELVRNEAIGALDGIVNSVGLTDTRELTRGLADAAPGTEEGTVAAALGLRGDSGDEGRVREALTDIVASVRDYREHLFGGTWEPSDFPETTRRVLCRIGVPEAPAGSILADVIEGDRSTTDMVHGGGLAVEVGHAIYEGAHFARHPSLLTGGPFAVALGGIALGLAIHHAVSENIEGRRDFAQELGL